MLHTTRRKGLHFFRSILFLSCGLTCGTLTAQENAEQALESRIEILTLATGERKMIYRETGRLEAPNWSRDGKTLLFNRKGQLYSLPVGGGTPALVATGNANHCNNDHGFSPDGKLIALSDNTPPANRSLIYVVPAAGGAPRLVTPQGPSYWHGWSPDGRTLAYCAERNGEYDIYTIPVDGGEERRLTQAPGLDDGPDYSPDGRYIYFNSYRTGKMKIWRMRADGREPEQLTHDAYSDWFAHPSPDGKWLIFVSYLEDQQDRHPPDKEVALRTLSLATGKVRTVVRLFGGQGTMNVPSWSPDGRQVAFVSYAYQKP